MKRKRIPVFGALPENRRARTPRSGEKPEFSGFVRYECSFMLQEKAALRLEIEDTGTGIDEKQAEEIRERIRNISVENMNGNRHVGMMNAYLRLHLFSKGHAEFELETEKDVGTTVRIGIPLGVI